MSGFFTIMREKPNLLNFNSKLGIHFNFNSKIKMKIYKELNP